ncbi:helix-turn-helix transcriptional regulator [Paenibacillus sp. N1-5-1-14]|uniref:winged helix-turn-helix transcriptional regulator n=1 Tax=Paenibacillus radicibacter TaxID=2972488 RepID=UPI002158B68C|nr:helix-turn-helix domain-containing protein [Paenibacillus radicibacter]MCR8644305.1 helix-turn-helix transcriptional regulator [Paenibacillus radicibacter]
MSKTYYCTVEATLDVMGGKWKPLILYHLADRSLRYNQLRRCIPNITQRMLTLHLKELEQDGLIVRTQSSDIPPKVDYALSLYGQSLRPILAVMCRWGGNHIEKNELHLSAAAVSDF